MRIVKLVMAALTLAAAALVSTVSASPAQAADCSGSLIEHLPVGSLGYLDIYYSSSTGNNCARLNSTGSSYGESKYMSVRLNACSASSTSVCNVLDTDSDSGYFEYYAGPVTVYGKGRCLRATYQIKSISKMTPIFHCG
ncbi:hypothetical protein SAMN05216275_15217 [Streptosporangium canum]|uniref:Spore-associated protein A n=1 Tax=Streptosporangium canum TaxID=324952 RepID=A0A1I4EQE9_9ACTN|nr:hypothetical protein SAMN05216275_15217 [Streptosporangium canum]